MTRAAETDQLAAIAEQRLAAVKAERAARWIDRDRVLTEVTRTRGHGYEYRQRLHMLVGTLESAIELIADSHEVANCHAPACLCVICQQVRHALGALAAFDEMASEA